jgi:3-oxoacyl-[acyl-carrier-protein] synthase II
VGDPGVEAAATRPVAVTGLAVRTAFGAGTEALLEPALAGTPAFAPVTRFGTAAYRTNVAATMPGTPDLTEELVGAVADACASAGLTGADRTSGTLLLAAHADRRNRSMAAEVATRTGLRPAPRTYTAACVAASTAIADAAGMIGRGELDRAVVAAGYLVDPDTFALFDAGRALARDNQARPFSAGRSGLLLGDAVAAVVLEPAATAAARGAEVTATVAGWGRAGDAYHVCQPRPDGSGLARAIEAALHRAGVAPAEVGYVNANGTGTPFSDAAETAALHTVFGPDAGTIPVSSTKSVHGHALEASGLVEFVMTALALRTGRLPVNAGWLGPDPNCQLDVIVEAGRPATPRYALSLNAAFGGANTALLVGAP